ncbi:hypothetical protein PNK_0381 [Candidatus Protochlamydia naegleriophila]|uniref:Uncharacterized protein n=1 Tax=Candidatus Protochlamydia naegleriophila TaxID=389348 RepID=A0A0U5JCA7_9BACT|nr:hypothetical protein [Candidatus Protochlamydia naegleriophila]CUI16015.1 hypothetical protein PNK_0381 [Candidatus Protochlamydia naegleriophila]
MKEKNPIEPLLAQVADLIKRIQEHQGPISDNITPRVLEEIERLENAVALFEEVNQKTLQEADIDIEALRMNASRSAVLSDKDKQVLQRAREIEKDAKSLQFAFSKVIERGKKAAPVQDPLKQQIKERRKRFKPLGGNKNWIPL